MSEFTVNTYSPDDLDLIISGYKVTGWERISITRSNLGFIPIKGIRGKDTRDRNKNNSATLSVSVLSSCPVNTIFSYIHATDLEYGTGRLVITLKDNSGISVFSSDEAYIQGYPPGSFGSDTELRVWNIQCQTTKSWVLGGNTKPATPLFDKITNYVSDLI